MHSTAARVATVVAASALAASLSACGRAASGAVAPAQQVTELRYQGSVGTVTLPELAADLGYLNNVHLRWIGNTISGPQDIQAATTGDTDFGGAFNGAVIKLVAHHAPVKAVVSYYGVDWLHADGELPQPPKLADLFTNQFNPYRTAGGSQ